MKSLQHLQKLYSILVNLLRTNSHVFGNCYGDCAALNNIWYEEGGWDIEISYTCTAEIEHDAGDYWTEEYNNVKSAYGELINLSVSHYDEETDEETEFTSNQLKELRVLLIKELENLI